MPLGELLTVPPPVPFLLTVRVCCTAVNVALTDLAAFIVTVHGFPVPESHPVQLVKVDPALATAVKTTEVPLVKVAEQVAPQLIPAGLLVTVPVPVPEGLTVKVKPAVAVPFTVKLSSRSVPAVPTAPPPIEIAELSTSLM